MLKEHYLDISFHIKRCVHCWWCKPYAPIYHITELVNTTFWKFEKIPKKLVQYTIIARALSPDHKCQYPHQP